MLDSLKTALEDIDEARATGVALDARTAMLMSCSRDCVKLMTPNGSLRYMSRNGRCVMEIDDLNAILGKKWWSLWPDSARGMLTRAVEEASEGHCVNFVAECPTAKGRPACWDVTVIGVPDRTGVITEIMSVSALTEAPARGLTIT
ncbi:hypothetical protein SAMN05421759_102562 [Roseivivax lentus]|uniref:PAS fold-4 domain-containing protein n=1 Tax=Roseivivax lentus TaxID=633194 RepID=A0A1N7LBU4_9RHOB|nr:PAS domain-containing protein [Roseivivax lentus]SIS71326.1 hypothetical protein SAMN05421759_102562 [Roseivivax lentus]